MTRPTWIGRRFMRMRVELSQPRRRVVLFVVVTVILVVVVLLSVFSPNQRRAKKHAARKEFYRLYEASTDALDQLAQPHEQRPVVLYLLSHRSDPSGFGAPLLALHHPGVRHMRVDEQCAPGYESIGQLSGRELLLGRLMTHFRAPGTSAERPSVADECVRSLGGDTRLLDTERDACAAPFELSCGGWRAYLDGASKGDLHRVNELSPDEYHLALVEVFADALADPDSLVSLVVASRPVVQPPRQSSLETPLVPVEEYDFAACALLALIRTDALTPVATMCDSVWPGCYDDYLDAVEQLEPQVLHSEIDCSRVLVTRGAMGDGGIIQVDMHGARQRVPGALDAVRYLSHLLAPFGAYYAGLDSDSTLVRAPGHLLRRVRLALPVGAEDPFGGRHQQRLLRLTLGETLQDRFSHYMLAGVSSETVNALISVASGCVLATDMGRAVRMAVPDPDQRSDAIDCMRTHIANTAVGWTSLAPLAQQCWQARRVQHGHPLLDMHVPSMGASASTLYFTPAMLQPPWYSDGMEQAETVARLYFPLVRAAYEANASTGRERPPTCEEIIEGNRRTVQALVECFSTLLLERSFWVQMMQNFCDHPTAQMEVPLATIHHTEGTPLWLRSPIGCTSTESTAQDMWTETLRDVVFFQRAFNCPRKRVRWQEKKKSAIHPL